MSNSDHRVIDELSEMAGQLLVSQLPATISATQLQGRNVATTAPADTFVLTWVASTAKWTPVAATGGGSPGGSSGAIQFNDAGAFGGYATIPNGIILGPGAASTEASGYSICIGANATASGTQFGGIAIGLNATVVSLGIAIGTGASAVTQGVALGYANICSFSESTVLGNSGFDEANGELVQAADIFDPKFKLQRWSSTNTTRNLLSIVGSWADPTDATRKSRARFQVFDWAGTREGIVIEADGTQALIGFFGAPAVARPSGSLLAGIAALGLMASPTISTSDIAGLGTMATQGAGAVAITGGTLGGVTISSHGGSYASSSSGAFDCSTADWFTRTLDGTNGTISLSNVQSKQQIAIELVQDGTGGRTVTYSGMTIVWMTSGGTAPTIASGAGLITTLTFKQISSGNYRGWLTGSQA